MSLTVREDAPSEHDYHINKKEGRSYISKSISTENGNIRIIRKVIDATESHAFGKLKDGLVIRVTPGGREELVAKFYEDDRNIFNVIFQKFTKKTGNPQKLSFSFSGNEIKRVVEFLSSIQDVHLETKDKIQIDDSELEQIQITDAQARKLVQQQPDIFMEIIRNDLNVSDIKALGYRREQLKKFKKLLDDSNYFEKEKRMLSVSRDEDVWQKFFEKNTWIFGYGLNYIFTSPLEDRKLEQIVQGFALGQRGKRVDALMKTRGFISSLCFAEIKTHKTKLLSTRAPRPSCWSISNELTDALAQIQKTVQAAVQQIQTKTELSTKSGDPTGETVYLYQPKSFLVIGHLPEFDSSGGINEEKYSSFELFRRNVDNPEIITFDELHERARFIVELASSENAPDRIGDTFAGI